MLVNLEVEKKVVGLKQSTKALKQDKVKVLYVAEDADIHLIQHLKDIANEKNVQVISINSMRELGKACGIDVGAAVAATLK